MANGDQHGAPKTWGPPRFLLILPGVAVGVAATSGLVTLELLDKTPRALVGLFGGVMSVAHGMAAFAVVTLLAQALSVALWERSLAERRRQIDGQSHPACLGDIDPKAFLAGIERATLDRDRAWRIARLASEVVAYIIPLIGFAVATWNSRPRASWEVAGRPLLLNLGESLFLMLLMTGVANSLEVVGVGWRQLSTACIPRQPGDAPFEEEMKRYRT